MCNQIEAAAMQFRFVLALFFAAVVSACATAQPHHPATLSIESKVDEFVQAQMLRGNVPGVAVCVTRHGAVLLSKAYGVANLELGAPVTTDSVFELASVTKQFTAAAILLLAHEGKLTLDDALTTFIDQAPTAWSDISIRHLLAHSSGLEHRFETSVNGILLLDYSTQDMLVSAKSTPTFAQAGKRFRYSDQGYFLLGLVVEKVTGRRYADFLAERFFTPLGMKDTTIQDQSRIVPNRVAGYTVKDGKLENIRRVWQFGLTSHFGVLSTISDMAKWEQSFWTGKVLPAVVLQQFWQPLYVFRRDESKNYLLAYGPGWWVINEAGHRMIEHSGITGTHYFKDATTGISIVVLTNRDQPSGPGTVEIARGIAQLLDPSIPVAPK
jgi:CubicO group peptidase (beta-lactamase class C family)